MAAHAKLGPSSASRWMECTPSAHLEAEWTAANGYTSSSYADEGTLAHSLGELIISHRLGAVLTKQYKAKLKKIQENQYYDADMQENCEQYAAYVLEHYAKVKVQCPDSQIFLEQRLDLTRWVPEGFGTGDVLIVADHVLVLIDLKYGKGVPVSAIKNKQLYLYGLGGVEAMEGLYGITDVNLHIYQPRISNFSEDWISKQELLQWADVELKPKAALAWEGKGEFKPGEHCRFCKIKATCKANAEENLKTVWADFNEENDFGHIVESGALEARFLAPENIAAVLSKADLFKNWIAAVEEYALDQAVTHGVTWPGFKLVEGRSNRKIADEKQAADELLKHCTADEIYNTKLKGITDLTKLLGSADFNRLLSPYIIKPAGKPVLVVEADKRPAFSSSARAMEDFKDEI